MAYKSVHELDNYEMRELTEEAFFEESEFGMKLRDEYAYWDDVPRSVIEKHYEGTQFTDDDFILHEEDDPYDKWDCEPSRDDWDEEESRYAL